MAHPLIILLRKSQSLGAEDGGGGVGALTEFLVKHVQTHSVIADELEFVDELAAVVFLLNLLADEPCEAVACGVVVLSLCGGEKGVDECGDFLLVLEGSLECCEGGFPCGGNGIDGRENHASATLVHIVHEDLGVSLLFLKLDLEPVSYSVASFSLEVH